MNSQPDVLDEYAYAIYIEVPGSQIVLLQALFELYEGLGVVRTLSVKKSLVCILTTPCMYQDCLALLNSIKNTVSWRIVERPSEAEKELYHGYQAKQG